MNITEYWSNFFGIEPRTFDVTGLHSVPHSALEDYWGVWIFKRKDSVIVSSHEKFLPTCNDLLSDADPSSICDSEVAARLFAPYLEQIIGPAYHGSLESGDFTPMDVSDGREISFDEVAVLNDGLDPTGWDWSGCGEVKEHYFGIFQNGNLAAASNHSIKDKAVAFPGIFTHPNYRGLGLAKLALTLAFQHSLKAGLQMDYQTLCSNVASIKAAESLGVKEFAQHVAIRLKEEDNNLF
jgi:hypothetical protein